MDRRGLTVTIVALMLAIVMASPSTASAPVLQELAPGSENGQPDHVNNTLYLFGNAQMSNCNSKFNSTDEDSADYGEQSKGGNGQLDVKVTCRMDPTLDEDVRLAVGENINMRFMLNLNGQWTNGQESCNGDCENLNISLMKGGREVAVREFASLSDGENQVVWDLIVTDDLVYWNGSQESMAIEFRMKIKSQAGEWIFADDEAIFGLFYTHPSHSPEYNATVTFPILNESAAAELDPETPNEGGDAPGFTAILGVGGLAAAAVLRPRKDA